MLNEGLIDVLSKIEKEGADIKVTDGKLMVQKSISSFTLTLIKEYKEELIKHLDTSPKPYISATGDLVIPFNSSSKYHWWQGEQSVRETLIELKAPPEIAKKYLSSRGVLS